jgi:hypothetical protein
MINHKIYKSIIGTNKSTVEEILLIKSPSNHHKFITTLKTREECHLYEFGIGHRQHWKE